MITQSSEMKVNWFQFNMPTIITVTTAFIGAVTWGNNLKTEQSVMKLQIEQLTQQNLAALDYRTKRSAQTDMNFASIKTQLEPISMLTYKVAQSESAIAEANKRIDRIVESFGGKLDDQRDLLNMVRTDLQLLTQEVKGKKDASLETIPPESRIR